MHVYLLCPPPPTFVAPLRQAGEASDQGPLPSHPFMVLSWQSRHVLSSSKGPHCTDHWKNTRAAAQFFFQLQKIPRDLQLHLRS